MSKLQSKSTAGTLALVCILFATAAYSAETVKPKAAPPSENRFFSPAMSPDELKAHREYMKTYKHFWTITVALTTRNARNPQPLSKEWQQRILEAAGIPLDYPGVGGGDMHTFTPLKKITHSEAEEIAARIRALPGILFAEPPPVEMSTDLAVPTDPLYSSQWNLKDGEGLGGASLPPAWDIITGKSTMVVAVIDSGVLASHPELSGRVLTGYDFITDTFRANDGTGRDSSPADPGNWLTAAEAIGGCPEAPSSSWHGTRVASIIAANTNNGVGMAGVDWQTRILPVRVSGKCLASEGVYAEADMRAAILWAAGLSVAGAPINANPASVINISVGRPSACSTEIQGAIDDARKNGVVIVAAVGNAEQVGAFSPASCNGVIRVAAVNQSGGLAKYSNRGETATLSAPGGAITDPLELKTAADGGATTPLNDGVIKGDMVGTSFAAPHVAGVAALMRAIKPEMSPPQIAAILANTTRNFPTNTSFDCDNITCGTGILDAGEAVMAARATQAGGLYHTAAVKSDGSVVAWGYNGNGQLGGGETLGLVRAYPGTPIASLSNMRDVATGDYHTAALKGDGTVLSWGYNGQGQLGNGTTTDGNNPVSVAGLTDVIAVAAGARHTLALKSDGTVWAWGYNYFGQLGRAPFNFTDSSTPVQVYGLTDVIAIAAGGKRSLALKKDGTVWAWGAEANVTNDTTASIYSAPLQVPGLADIVAIAAGGDVSTAANIDANMALTWDGKVYAWGYRDLGVLCLGDNTSHMLPQEVTGFPAPAVSVATSGKHTVALLDDGSQWACGQNLVGQLGDGTTTDRPAPVQVGGGLQKVLDVSVGAGHTMTVSGDLSVRSWGWNNGGQLGDGTQTNRSLPQQVHGAGNSGFYNAGYATSTNADLEISLSDSPDPALVGANLTYDLQLINYGPDAATGVSAVLSLPSQISFVSATSGCSYANSLVTCTLSSLNSASNASFQVVVQPGVATTLDASASVSSAVFDPVGSNNVAGTSTVADAATPTDGDVPIPAWALVALGAGLLGSMRRKAGWEHT